MLKLSAISLAALSGERDWWVEMTEKEMRRFAELAQDFYDEYGYLPDWFWPE